jgi:hypothetical protein
MSRIIISVANVADKGPKQAVGSFANGHSGAILGRVTLQVAERQNAEFHGHAPSGDGRYSVEYRRSAWSREVYSSQ